MGMILKMLQEEWQKEKQFSFKLAYVLSRMFDTSVTVFLVAMVFVFKAEPRLMWILVMAAGNLVLPIFFLVSSFRAGRIRDLDLTHRNERVVWFTIAAAFWVLTLLIILIFDAINAPEIMKVFQIWLAVFGVLNAAITYVWKISGHVMVATALSLWLSFLWNPWFALLLITLVPLIAWARLRLDKHTPAQLVVGFLLMLLVTPAIWRLFG